MKEIGGYFELELSLKEEYHKNAIKLNSGRNALKYILKSQKINKVYIPLYICDSVIEPLKELNINYEFYNLDRNFEIISNIKLTQYERLFYVNYFALKSNYIKQLISEYSDKVILDNTQAFFEKPLQNIDTIYSPRKFFGVSDGGYLYTNKTLQESISIDESYKYSKQLLGRIEYNASEFYNYYQEAENRLSNESIKKMSNLTQRILSSIDYNEVSSRRRENFYFFHCALKEMNLLKFEFQSNITPFAYPFMSNDDNLRKKLIENKIYVATYWNEVLQRDNCNSYEMDFVNKLIPLPIDQRYSMKDLERILTVIKGTTHA